MIEVKFFKGRAGQKKLSAMSAEVLGQIKSRKYYDILLLGGAKEICSMRFALTKITRRLPMKSFDKLSAKRKLIQEP